MPAAPSPGTPPRGTGHAAWRRRGLLTLSILAALASVFFGLRSAGSLQLMRSAYAVGVPGLSNLRPWMTLRVVAATWGTPQALLISRLDLAADTPPDTDLKTLAEAAGVSKLDYTQRVQAVVAELAAQGTPDASAPKPGAWSAFGDSLLAALLAYGYPVLGLTLLLGAVGVPLPAGLVAAAAGALVAQGKLSGAWAGTLAVTASVAGDVLGYGLGRWAGEPFLARWGRWLGATPARRARVAGQMQRYDLATVLLTRTLVSSLSAVVNLLAGVSRCPLGRFVALACIGRLLWTSAYLGLGYAVGGELDAATRFLQNLAGLLVALALLAGTGMALRRPSAGLT